MRFLRRRPATVGPRFEVVDRTRLFEPLSPGFVAVDEQPGSADGLVRSEYSPPAPFVTVEVALGSGPGTTVAGLAAANGDHLLGFHDPTTNEAGLELSVAGTTTVLRHRHLRHHPKRMALVLLENRPTVLMDFGNGWRPAFIDRDRVRPRIDFRDPATLVRFTAAWGSRGGTTDLATARAGLFGMAGMRDLHLVQHADGSPYVSDGRLFLTATCSGLGFFQQAHWGVFSLDAAALAEGRLELEQTGHLFSHRDGLLLGDHAGQLVRGGDRWLVAVSSWGDFTPQSRIVVRHTDSTDDLLHGAHVLETEVAPIPTSNGHYDPGMTRIDGRWYVSYVESVGHQPSDFHPGLAVGPAGATHWTEGLERVGQDASLHQTEGPILAQPSGPDTDWLMLASDGHERCYRAYDLGMKEVGRLDAPYGSNIPHPMVFDLPASFGGGRFLITFDGTPYAEKKLRYGTHGDVILMRATPAGG
ncbi:MAG: hypothetical protein ACOYX5_12290 [Actinomycetota bacterium]